MARMPHAGTWDSTLSFLTEGYRFIGNRCERYQSDVFETRVLLQRTICMRGEEAARLFYDSQRFQRQDAAPRRLQTTLLGEGGVQALDGDTHRHRKQMFMSLMTPQRIAHLAALSAEQWRQYGAKWQTMSTVVLFDEVQEMLCRAVCAWAGVPLEEKEVGRRTADLAALIEASGAVGPRHWRGRVARRRSERWIADLIEAVRARRVQAPEESAIQAIAWHRDIHGELLTKKVAAVEMINLLRPTVAVGRFITFTALALHDHSEYRRKLVDQGEPYYEWFVHEVRRFYPFFPAAVARVRNDFEWKGYFFPRGTRALLDLFGTDRDARVWQKPDEFLPERFARWNDSAFNFIPQGGGDHYKDHRCAGEWITVELMKLGLKALTTSIAYDVPDQDLSVSLSRVPTLPKSRFIITNVRPA